ncbi:MAG: hypothetical protein KatS3mg003_0931 [Candidatus Nitrosocaldaceae archaeon]|nr:MAG: hypothetical protein KatS3mg003_0931 [Candidatus Nitrosocaldaceae archaeon]
MVIKMHNLTLIGISVMSSMLIVSVKSVNHYISTYSFKHSVKDITLPDYSIINEHANLALAWDRADKGGISDV